MAVLMVSPSKLSSPILAFALALAFLATSPPGLSEATNSGDNPGEFTVELIHRDSPNSPLYNPSETPSQRLSKSLLRSLRRIEYLSSLVTGDAKNRYSSSRKDISGQIRYDYSGEYLVKVGFGSPKIETHLIFDTSSNLIWTQCKGCTKCIRLKIPALDPSSSSSYNSVACESHSCNSFNNTCYKETCLYSVEYGGGLERTSGLLGQETFALTSADRSVLTFDNIVFGCGYDNEVLFSGSVSGIMGMGNGMTSFPAQMRYQAGPWFSYCFARSNNVPGRLSFGRASVVAGAGVVSTPLILYDYDNLYRLTLEAITIGGTKIGLGDSLRVGNMVIDSSTVPTLLPAVTYWHLENEVRKIVKAKEIHPPIRGLLPILCYSSRVHIPHTILTMHLTQADIHLKLSDMFVGYSAGIACFAFGPAPNDVSFVYGNRAQSNFEIGFEIDAKTLYFKPSDCTTK